MDENLCLCMVTLETGIDGKQNLQKVTHQYYGENEAGMVLKMQF